MFLMLHNSLSGVGQLHNTSNQLRLRLLRVIGMQLRLQLQCLAKVFD